MSGWSVKWLQKSGHRCGHPRPATPKERLASMERELNRRLIVYGEGSYMVSLQREALARQELAQREGSQ